jgi:Skp family chaperone for outer membrane proteins
MKWLTGINIGLLAVLLVLFIKHERKTEKTGFVMNQQVFDRFKGKIDLEQKLEKVQKSHKRYLDSLNAVVLTAPLSFKKERVEIYRQAEKRCMLEEKQLSDTYTRDIWSRINAEVADFAKENGYTIILGASGDGNLMYAADSHNVTEQVITYMNSKY